MPELTRPGVPAVAPSNSPRNGRPRDEARRQAALHEAALELLSELSEIGFDRMTMEAVAARAGTSKATAYRRWCGKARRLPRSHPAHAAQPVAHERRLPHG